MKVLLVALYRCGRICRKAPQILLKLKIIYDLSYFDAYFRRLSLAQAGDRRTLLHLKLIQLNYIITIVRHLIFRFYQKALSSKINGLFLNIVAIEHFPTDVNLALVSFLLNGMHFQHVLYFENDGITSVIAQMLLQEQNDSLFLRKHFYVQTSSLLGRTITLFCSSFFDSNINSKKHRVPIIRLFTVLIIALKNKFQFLFFFLSKIRSKPTFFIITFL